MDYFQEARWEFDEKTRLNWYEKVVREKIVQPRIPRYGIMRSETCSSQCSHRYKLRTDPEYAVKHGFPAHYASSSIALLGVRCYRSNTGRRIVTFKVNLLALTISF